MAKQRRWSQAWLDVRLGKRMTPEDFTEEAMSGLQQALDRPVGRQGLEELRRTGNAIDEMRTALDALAVEMASVGLYDRQLSRRQVAELLHSDHSAMRRWAPDLEDAHDIIADYASDLMSPEEDES